MYLSQCETHQVWRLTSGLSVSAGEGWAPEPSALFSSSVILPSFTVAELVLLQGRNSTLLADPLSWEGRGLAAIQWLKNALNMKLFVPSSVNDDQDQPCAGTPSLLDHDCHHNNDRHSHAESWRTIDDWALHGLQDVVLAGVAPVGRRAHTGSFSVDFHAAAIVTAPPPAAFCSAQVQQQSAGIQGGVQARDFRECRDGGGWGRGAVGARSEASASQQRLHDDT